MKFGFDKILKDKSKVIKTLIMFSVVLTSAIITFPSVETVFKEVYATANAKKKDLPIYSVDIKEKKVAISFDAAWGADDTDELLSILDEYNVKTTFFVCGYWVDKYPEQVKKIYEKGHDIGNHGGTHAHHAKLDLEENKKEIMNVHNKIKDLLGIEMNLFRPPFGEYNNTVLQAAKEVGYYTIQWDVDSHDWMNKGVNYEIDRVLKNKNLKDGSIILFHNDAKDTPKALPIILKGLQEQGYQIVKISEIIHKDNYHIDHEGRQKLN